MLLCIGARCGMARRGMARRGTARLGKDKFVGSNDNNKMENGSGGFAF